VGTTYVSGTFLEQERKLFGTNGVRGIVNKELTPELVLKLSIATGTYFKGSDLAVGCDGRTSSPMLMDIVTAGLSSAGCQVWSLGQVTTPALQYLTKDWGLKGSIIVTASHNPPEYNGFKVMGSSGVELSHEEELKIEQIYFKSRRKLAQWKNIKEPILVSERFESYINSVLSHLDWTPNRSLKVLIDPANGVSVLATPRILESMNGRVSIINGEIDGTFPGRLPEPTPCNLRKTSQALPSLHADFGVAHDGDGDRAIFLDEHGKVCWGDQTLALIVQDYLQNYPGEKIVTPISSSQIIEEIAERYGSEVVYTPVGSVYVSNLMLKMKINLGGEENGGIFYAPHVAARDGGIAAAWIYKIIAETHKPLSRLISQLPPSYFVKEKIHCPDSIKFSVNQKIMALRSRGKTLKIDGVKIWIPPHSWVLIRPSGTEPIYRIIVEAPTKGQAMRIARDYKTKLSKIIKDCRRRV
jgi:phosphomannomutase/phosphoglucomutase